MGSDVSTLKPYADLWEALRTMRIEAPGATRSFESALARENGWSLGRAHAVSLEYRRFLYLAAAADAAVTPSEAVDRAWHLHLTYTRHYWDLLCGEILRRPLHHVPSDGSAADEARYSRQYEETLVAYERAFGEPPPSDIWPRADPEPPVAQAELLTGWRDRIFVPALVAGGLTVVAGAWAGGVVGFLGAFMVAAAAFHFLGLVLPPAAAAQPKREKGSCGGGGCSAGLPASSDDAASGASCGGGCSGGCGS